MAEEILEAYKNFCRACEIYFPNVEADLVYDWVVGEVHGLREPLSDVLITYKKGVNLDKKAKQLKRIDKRIKTGVLERMNLIVAKIPLEKLVEIARDEDIVLMHKSRTVEVLKEGDRALRKRG